MRKGIEVHREGDGFVATCDETKVASQGDTLDEAIDNLEEAVGLFLATASASEIEARKKPGMTSIKEWVQSNHGSFEAEFVPSDEGVAARVPGLSGVNSQGASLEEARVNIASAIDEWIEAGDASVKALEAREMAAAAKRPDFREGIVKK